MAREGEVLVSPEPWESKVMHSCLGLDSAMLRLPSNIWEKQKVKEIKSPGRMEAWKYVGIPAKRDTVLLEFLESETVLLEGRQAHCCLDRKDLPSLCCRKHHLQMGSLAVCPESCWS